MLKAMIDLNVQISIEGHLNYVVEACLRAGKHDKVNEVMQISGMETIQQSTLQILVKGGSKTNKIDFALHYYR